MSEPTEKDLLPSIEVQEGFKLIHQMISDLEFTLPQRHPTRIACELTTAMIRLYSPNEYRDTDGGGIGYYPETSREFSVAHEVRKLIHEGQN